jgi:hypothetical protein
MVLGLDPPSKAFTADTHPGRSLFGPVARNHERYHGREPSSRLDVCVEVYIRTPVSSFELSCHILKSLTTAELIEDVLVDLTHIVRMKCWNLYNVR